MIGKYICKTASTTGYIYQITSNSTPHGWTEGHSAGPSSPVEYVSYTHLTNMKSYTYTYKYMGVVRSDSPTAYPENGWIDTTQYIKQALANVSIPKISYSTYSGNGKYGSNTPTVLTFDFDPAFVYVVGYYENTKTLTTYDDYYGESRGNYTDRLGAAFTWVKGNTIGKLEGYGIVYSTMYYGYGSGVTSNANNYSTSYCQCSYESSTKSLKLWDTSNALNQMNGSGYTYHIIAIG